MPRGCLLLFVTGCGLLSGPDPADPAACNAFADGTWDLIDGGADATTPTSVLFERAYQVNLRPEQVNWLQVTLPGEIRRYSVFTDRADVVTAIDGTTTSDSSESLWCEGLSAVPGADITGNTAVVELGPAFQASTWIYLAEGPVAEVPPTGGNAPDARR